MPRPRFVPRTASDAPMRPFDSAEEAWFWFARCQRARQEGAAFRDSSDLFQRPCDPDDIYRAAIALRRRGVVSGHHLTVLARFGFAERPPDPRHRDEAFAAKLWDEALDRLTTILRAKGIIE